MLCPFILGLGTVLIDLARFRSAKEELTQTSNDLALQAAQLLPNTDDAKRFIKADLLRLQRIGIDGEATFQNEGTYSVQVTLRSTSLFSFDVLLTALGLERIKLRGFARSRASLAPRDTVIAISDGDTLRPGISDAPQLGAKLDTPWGEPSQWPSAKYLSSCVVPPNSPAPERSALWLRQFSDDNAKRWATQSCFNPIVSEYKAALIELIHTITLSGNDRLGVIFTPGQTGADVIRPLIKTKSEDGSLLSGLLESSRDERGAEWLHFDDQVSLLGDSVCALIALFPGTDRYRLPATMIRSSLMSPCLHTEQSNQCILPLALEDYSRLTKCDLRSALSLEESIYYRAIRARDGASRALPRLSSAISSAIALFSATETQDIELSHTRGAMRAYAKRHFVFIADTLAPESADELRVTLEKAKNLQVEMILAIVDHDTLSPEEHTTRAQRLEIVLEAMEATQIGRIIHVPSPLAIHTKLAPFLFSLNKQVLLQSAEEYESL